MFNNVAHVVRSNKVYNSVQKSYKTSVGGISCKVIQVLVIKGA